MTFKFLLVMGCFVFLAGQAVLAGDTRREKVLLDTDMVEAFDDGVAMVMLANAPNVDLVGVTTVCGNSWSREGAAFALRQLEIEGRDIPVAIGLRFPFRPQRHELFSLERQMFGIGEDAWVGSFGHAEPEAWDAVYRQRYGREPEYRPDSRHAVDFIIDTIRANPGEITIAAIGPCGNLAMAVRKDPGIVPLVKRVIYMGGSFFKPGNVTPAAEFNWWFDPEAARIAVRSPFAEQIMVGLDVCEKVVFDKKRYDALLDVLGQSPQADILRSTHTGSMFASEPGGTQFIWDVLVAAIIIDPGIVTGEAVCGVDVNDTFSLSYGQSLAYREFGPEGSQRARIVLDIDRERFWSMLLDRKYWRSAQGDSATE